MPVNFDRIVRKTNSNVAYDQTYVDAAFVIWYKNGRPETPTLITMLPVDEQGRVATPTILQSWIKKYQWHERADLLDAAVTNQVEKMAVTEKVEMLNRHAEAGKMMIDKAEEYIKSHEIGKMADAIKMLVQGVEIETASRGLPSALIKLSEMNDETLNATVAKLMARMNPDEAINFIGTGVKEGEPAAEEGEFKDAD